MPMRADTYVYTHVHICTHTLNSYGIHVTHLFTRETIAPDVHRRMHLGFIV